MTAPSYVWSITGPWGNAGDVITGATDNYIRFLLGRGLATSAGGGSSTSLPDGKTNPYAPPSSPNAMNDEFNDTTGNSGPINGLNARWSKVGLGTAGWLVMDDLKAPGQLLFDIPAAQAANQLITQPVPAGDFRAEVGFQWLNPPNPPSGNRQIWGLFVADSTGAGIGAYADINATGSSSMFAGLLTFTANYAIASRVADGAGQGKVNDEFENGRPVRLIIRKSSGTYSVTGISGHQRIGFGAVAEVSNTPTAFTAATIGFGRVNNTGAAKVALDYFRVT